MKLRKGESRQIYLRDDLALERSEVLSMVQGQSLSDGRAVVEQFDKTKETVWVDRYGQEQAKSSCDSVSAIYIVPANAEERQRELLDGMKAGLEAISAEDCSLEDIRKALRAQIAYSEFIDLMND